MSANSALVSIVLPVFNAEAFLEDAIESCIMQSYRPIEIICVDNNSYDNSAAVLEKNKQDYPDFIKILKERNPGAPAARNTGMAAASGEFIYFLDADDALYPNAISTLIGEMEEGIDAVCGSETYFNNDFSSGYQFKRLRIQNNDLQVSDILRNHPNTGAVLLRKSSLKNVKWDTSLDASQELIFWIQLCLENNTKFKYIRERVCKIRLHHSPFRISNQNKKKRALLKFSAIQKMELLIKSSPFKTETAAIAFNDFLLRHAFSAISARNFKASTLIARKVEKRLILRSPDFRPISREGVTYISNHYLGFLFHFLGYRILGKYYSVIYGNFSSRSY